VIIIKILLFGQFGSERARISRFFGQCDLAEYDAPLGLFVTSRFRDYTSVTDVVICGGEPKSKPYIQAAKKAGCKLALWGCETAWIKRCQSTLPLFDIIFALDTGAYNALRQAGFDNVTMPPKETPPPVQPKPEPVPEPIPEPVPEFIPEPIPEPEPEPVSEPESPMIDLTDLPAIQPLSEEQDEAENPGASVLFKLKPRTHAYGVVNKNENVRAASAAGGVFTLLCEETIGRGGVVFGAKYGENFETVHAMASRMPECGLMRGVKYAVSADGGIYDQAVSCLHQGKPVLFTGTACQIKKLYGSLGGKSDHPMLLTADVVCGGAADPQAFKAYLKFIEEKIGPVTAVDFSGKPMGLGRATVRIGSESNTYEVSVNADPFMRGYRAGLFLREECYDCPHRNEQRASDLTLGSFPGGAKHIPELYDDKGASLVLAHTEKGFEIMDALARRAVVREVPPDALLDYNAAIVTVPTKHKRREAFYADMAAMRFDKAVSRSIGPAVWGILTAKRSILPIWRKITCLFTKR
jgi:hypothetical protein